MLISCLDIKLYHINSDSCIEAVRNISENKNIDAFLITSPDNELKFNYVSRLVEESKKQNPRYGFFYCDYIYDDCRVYLPSFSRRMLRDGLILPKTGLYKKVVFDVIGPPNPEYPKMWWYDLHLRMLNGFAMYHVAEELYTTNNQAVSLDEIEKINAKYRD